MIKAIVFDLDGTLLNSTKDIKNSLNKVLKDNNQKTYSDKEVEKFLGYGSYNLIKDALPKGSDQKLIDKVYNEYVNYYSKNSNIHTKPYYGIMELIDELKESGLKLAICSNKMNNAVVKLNLEKFENKFDVAVGESELIKVKPNPDMILYAIKELNITKDEVLFIGDTEVDLKAAKNANVKNVAVTWGFRDKEFLIKQNPTHIIDKPNELLNIIKDYND